MPYEITVLVQLSAIDTEDEAVILSNRVQETVTNALFTASGIVPSGGDMSDDLVVSLGSFIEYDADTGEYTRIIHPAELSFEEARQKIIRIGVDIEQAHRVTCSHCGGQVRLAPDGRTMFHADAKTLQGDCLGSRELPSEETQERIRTGVDQAYRGETKDLGSFAQYADD